MIVDYKLYHGLHGKEPEGTEKTLKNVKPQKIFSVPAPRVFSSSGGFYVLVFPDFFSDSIYWKSITIT
jgi:hypothetical protein